jgi:hypothetical protein
MNPDTVALSPDDGALTIDVLSTNSSMHSTAYAVKFIEQRLGYPIENIEALLGAFGDDDYIAIRNCRISRDQVRQYLPQDSFPIHNRLHLICHLILAFERERMSVLSRRPTFKGPETK